MSDYDKICPEARFLADVKDHTMTIIQDAGVNRHVRYRKNNSSVYGFDLITWAGHLCISGDCGTFVFRRTEDMFGFFGDKLDSSKPLQINPQYWAEKIEATEKDGGHKKWSNKRFCERVKDYFETHTEGWDRSRKDKLWYAIESDVIDETEDDQSRAMTAVSEFEYDGFQFNDFWEYDCGDYTFHYIWCLYAIVWGIRKYEKERSK